LAALLWRLPVLGIILPPEAKAIQKYADKIFERKSFQESLSDAERGMREEA
jgi:RNA polymerase-associated protein